MPPLLRRACVQLTAAHHDHGPRPGRRNDLAAPTQRRTHRRTGASSLPPRYAWARLLARIDEALPLVYCRCGARCASSPSSPPAPEYEFDHCRLYFPPMSKTRATALIFLPLLALAFGVALAQSPPPAESNADAKSRRDAGAASARPDRSRGHCRAAEAVQRSRRQHRRHQGLQDRVGAGATASPTSRPARR